MAKFKYVARLRNGREVTRNSDRTYTHYWRTWGESEGGDSGFARSYELASRAASSAAKLLRKRLGHMAKIETEIGEGYAATKALAIVVAALHARASMEADRG